MLVLVQVEVGESGLGAVVKVPCEEDSSKMRSLRKVQGFIWTG